MGVRQKSIALLLGTFVAYGVLVATNEGEFWPFSIYPMFSQAGKPWSRAVVVEVEDDIIAWDTLTASELPGRPYALLEHGIDPIDLSNFVSKTRVWDEARVSGLHRMFGYRGGEYGKLVVMRVNGVLTPSDSVILNFVPYAALSDEGVDLNPVLIPNL